MAGSGHAGNALPVPYSRTTRSRITEMTVDEVQIQAQRERPLLRPHAVLTVDAFFVGVRWDTVAKEAVPVVLGITETSQSSSEEDRSGNKNFVNNGGVPCTHS